MRRLLRGLRDSSKYVLAGAVIAALVATLAITFYQRFNFSGPYRVEYEGRVVRKSLTVTETDEGSRRVLRLHVRGKGGEEFQVIVNRSLYGRAQEGMWIRSSREGAELSWVEP